MSREVGAGGRCFESEETSALLILASFFHEGEDPDDENPDPPIILSQIAYLELRKRGLVKPIPL